MEGCSRDEEACPKLLDLISKDREWLVERDEQRSHGSSEEKKLELRLGPPGEDWVFNENLQNNIRDRDESLLSLGYFSSMASSTHNTNNGCQTPWSSSGYQVKTQQTQQQTKASFLQFSPNTTPQSLPAMGKESSQPCCTKVVDLQTGESKGFSSASGNTAVPNSSQKRTAPGPVVGWPPIRSFRKNLASNSSSKPAPESNVVPNKVASKKQVESCRKGLFVKINMDGVPIGRKVDLNAYDSYEKLSSAVDELFRGLLAAQRDSSTDAIQNKPEEERAITGVLDGSGEYTLVYEDNEGDRMLVGDVPWHMFVSTVKRLRLLKSSEISTLSLGSSKQQKNLH